jgi:hypothetical protein
MHNPGTQATLYWAQDAEQSQTKQKTHWKLKRWATCTPIKTEMNPGAHEG